MLKVKREYLNIETLQKYGFKTGKELAEVGVRGFEGIGYEYRHQHFFKLPMDPDEPEQVWYADDEFDQPLVEVEIRSDSGHLSGDCTPSGTYHIGGHELDTLTDVIFQMTQDGILEVDCDDV